MTLARVQEEQVIDLDELARLEREANAEQEAEERAAKAGLELSPAAYDARDALTVAMRNALPGLLEELRHLRLGPGTCPNCGATRVNGLYGRVYDWARRWKQLAKRLRRRNKFLVRASRQYGSARAQLAAVTERAERAEAEAALVEAKWVEAHDALVRYMACFAPKS